MNTEPAKFIKRFGLNSKRPKHDIIAFKKDQVCKTKVQQSLLQKERDRINLPKSISKQELKQFQVIGMMKNQIFCIFSKKHSIYGAVDQHAIHQRIRYEYYGKVLRGESQSNFIIRSMQKHENRKKIKVVGETDIQNLIYIKKLSQEQFFNKQIHKFGIQIQVDKEGNAYMKKYRQVLGKKLDDQQLKKICQEIIQLETKKENKIPATLDWLIAQAACKSAIKFGDSISKEWCTDVLYNATLCDFPWQCVHGRTTIYFHHYQLEKPRIYSLD